MQMRLSKVLSWVALGVSSVLAFTQDISAPEPQRATLVGTVVDTQEGIIPSATAVLDGSDASDHLSTTADQNGLIRFVNLRPSVVYHLTITAPGFADWKSSGITLQPGQFMDLSRIRMRIAVVETSVTAITVEQLATEQVHREERQRVLGIVPNYFVTYDPNSVPLPARLKFHLALKTATDVVTFGGVALLSGIDQAADTPDYSQGAEGFGQRFGANYVNGFSDTMLGGAILPSLFHQDPRYFYKGTGTTKSRLLYALSSPIRCKGDNGKWQFNFSSIGGDLGAGALANLYYPDSNRGPGLTFAVFGTDMGARVVLAVAQEFILRKVTPSAKK